MEGRPAIHEICLPSPRGGAAAALTGGALLSRIFYARPAVEVAPELLGKLLVRRLDSELLSGWIVEVEAYMGSEDPPSHAYRGQTLRNRSMFGPPGHLYVYRSYGVHSCANVVTSEEGVATAVLLRAVRPEAGLETMRRLRGLDDDRILCRGPGRLCQAMGITTTDDGADLLGRDLFILESDRPVEVVSTSRIGISTAADKPWRFVVPGSPFVSGRRPPAVAAERASVRIAGPRQRTQ